MKSKLYDVNVYVIDGQVKVIFYKLIYSDALDGSVIGADTSVTGEAGQVSFSINSTDPAVKEAIRYVLDAEEYDNRPLEEWEEFDEWNTTDWFLAGDTPRLVKEFADRLPEYEAMTEHRTDWLL